MAEYIRRNSIKISKNNQIYILTIIVVFSFICYALKLFSMQILDGRNYRQQSRNISSQVKIIPAQRGEIFDRNANLPLVINTDSFAVDLIPAEIPEGYYDTITLKLAKYLGISKKDIDRKVPANLRRSFSSIEIRGNISFDVISNIAETTSIK